MAGYLLNLVIPKVDDAAKADALFKLNSADATSRMWYKVPAGWPGPAYDPNSAVREPAPVSTWPQASPFPVLDDGNFGCVLGDDIYMRVLPDYGFWPRTKIDGGNKVQPLLLGFSAVFGRAATSGPGAATIATPFVFTKWAGPGNQSPLTMFSGAVVEPTATDGSSIYYMGKAAQNVMGGAKRGDGPHGQPTTSYSFIVAGYLAYNNIEGWSFGHDPKMQVGGSSR